jgi:sugar O-acyltransferase (sialic acid O-acetyltransferase NeuD family)
MKELLILGTGVHALEMIEIVERVNQAAPTWKLLGLISADEQQVGQELNGAPVLGTPGDLGRYPSAFMVPSLPDLKLMGEGLPMERMASLIDPSTFVSRTAVIGRGCVIYPNCYIGLNVRLDDFVFSLSGSVINHDDVIGYRTCLTAGVSLAGSVTVGPECYLGQACNVRQLLTIGRHCMIGMGAVVVKDVEPDSVMVGNPARRVRAHTQPAF